MAKTKTFFLRHWVIETERGFKPKDVIRVEDTSIKRHPKLGNSNLPHFRIRAVAANGQMTADHLGDYVQLANLYDTFGKPRPPGTFRVPAEQAVFSFAHDRVVGRIFRLPNSPEHCSDRVRAARELSKYRIVESVDVEAGTAELTAVKRIRLVKATPMLTYAVQGVS